MSNNLAVQEQIEAVRLGKRLRTAREAAGLSLRELAQHVGLRDHTVLIKYERGATAPTSVRLLSMARALGCSAAALLAERDAAVPIITKLDEANDERLAQFSFFLETLNVVATHPDEERP